MKFLGRIILFFGIVIVGIACLPQGFEKLNYIFKTLVPSVGSYIANIKEDAEEEDEEEESDVAGEEETTAHIKAAKPEGSKNIDKNRKAVHNMIGENYQDSVLASGKLTRWNPRSFPLKIAAAQL